MIISWKRKSKIKVKTTMMFSAQKNHLCIETIIQRNTENNNDGMKDDIYLWTKIRHQHVVAKLVNLIIQLIVKMNI